MNIGKTLGLATAATALTLWPHLASAQESGMGSEDIEIEILPLEEEPAEAEEEEHRTEKKEYKVEEEAVRVEEGTGAGEIIIEQPAPDITVEQPPVDVRVEQPAPEVRVEQPRPGVRVEQVGEPEVRYERDVEVEVETEAPARAEEELFEEEAIEAEEMMEPLDDLGGVLTPLETEGIAEPYVTPFGTQLQVGAGYRNFIGSTAQDFTAGGGFWDVRGIVGTRSIIGAELAYTGSNQPIDAIGLSETASLLSNGVEGDLRLNAPIPLSPGGFPVLVEPYALAGIGWQYWNLINEGVNTSSVASDDNILTVPLGVGLSVGLAGFIVDGRLTYRQAFFNDLFGTPTSSFSGASLNQWQAGVNVGFEF